MLDSWSLTVLAKEKFGGDPAKEVTESLRPYWGSESKKQARYQVFYRIGRNNL